MPVFVATPTLGREGRIPSESRHSVWLLAENKGCLMSDEPMVIDVLVSGSTFFQQHVTTTCLRAEMLADKLEASGSPADVQQVRQLWTEAELPSFCAQTWARVWSAVRNSAHAAKVMSRKERKALLILPEVITVFRGARRGGERGWSWTLDRAVAADFAVRYADPSDAPGTARLYVARVRRDDVVAYFEIGGEREVIIDPETIDWHAVGVEQL